MYIEKYPELVCGYVDRLGYLRCVACAKANKISDDRPVYSDASGHGDEPCDSCKAIVSQTGVTGCERHTV